MIHYHTTTIIHLSLEHFYNEGLTKEEAKSIIEGIQDPGGGSGMNLRCHPQFINGNWNVETLTTNPTTIGDIVELIRWHLEYHLNHKQSQKEQPIAGG